MIGTSWLQRDTQLPFSNVDLGSGFERNLENWRSKQAEQNQQVLSMHPLFLLPPASPGVDHAHTLTASCSCRRSEQPAGLLTPYRASKNSHGFVEKDTLKDWIKICSLFGVLWDYFEQKSHVVLVDTLMWQEIVLKWQVKMLPG